MKPGNYIKTTTTENNETIIQTQPDLLATPKAQLQTMSNDICYKVK